MLIMLVMLSDDLGTTTLMPPEKEKASSPSTALESRRPLSTPSSDSLRSIGPSSTDNSQFLIIKKQHHKIN